MAIDAQSLLLADAGEIERAIEYHALVMAHPYFGNSEFRKAVTGQFIDECADTLSPKRVRAAEKRGVVRDVWAIVDEILAAYETEIRPVFEADDFGEEFTPELREKEESLRSQVEAKE